MQGDEIPQQALYTDTWRFVIPEVYIRCPGCPMGLNATVTSAPQTTFDPASGIISQGRQEKSGSSYCWDCKINCLAKLLVIAVETHQEQHSLHSVLETGKEIQPSFGFHQHYLVPVALTAK